MCLLQKKAGIEAKNEAETQVYSAESSLREYKDKLPQNVVDNINTEISNVRSSLESGDAEEIRSKVTVAPRCPVHFYELFLLRKLLVSCLDSMFANFR